MIKLIAIVTLFLAVTAPKVFSTEPAPDSTIHDSTLSVNFPPKRPARKAWEYIVSAPLWIGTSPLYLTYRLIATGIEFIDENDIPEKINRILVSDDGTRKINPYYSSTTGGGVLFVKSKLFESNARLKLAGSYGTLHRHGLESEITDVAFVPNRLFLDATALYHHVPDEPFFGIGPDNCIDDKSLFLYDNVYSLLTLRTKFLSLFDLFIAGSTDYFHVTKGKGDKAPALEKKVTSLELPIGYDTKAMFGGVMGGLLYDTRDVAGHTHNGTLLKAHVGLKKELPVDRFSNSRSERFGLRHVTIDLSQYMQLPWGRHRILVIRGAMERRIPLNDDKLPFYLLSGLGSDGTLRGFTRGRFRDNDYLIGSMEYHYPIWEDVPNLLSTVLFVNGGKVASNIIQDFNQSTMHVGFGGGFRVYNEDDLIASILFGFSSDDFRIEFSLGDESFTRILDIIKKYSEI